MSVWGSMATAVVTIALAAILTIAHAQVFTLAPDERPCGAIIIKNEFEDIARIGEVEVARARLASANAWYQRCREKMFADDREWLDIRAASAEESLTWPRTIEQAVAEIVSELSEDDRAMVRMKSREELIGFHHGWGTGIRNGTGLWRGNNALLASVCGEDPCHPDEASMKIIEAVWERLQVPGDD